VEARVGAVRYIVLYFSFIAASNFLSLFFLFADSLWSNQTFWDLLVNYHSLGASGAVSGVMGLFVIRCHFSKVTIALPFLLLPIISFPVRIHALLLVGLFFAMDISGSFHVDSTSNVDYWAHVGGYLAGIYGAWRLGLHREVEDEARKYKAAHLRSKYAGREEATRNYMEILEKESGDKEALEHLLMVSRYNNEKSAYYYRLLMAEFVKHDFSKAIDLFNDHYPSHVKCLSPKILYRFGHHFFTRNELPKAMTCLEFASQSTGLWQAKSLLLLARSYMAVGNAAMAGITLDTIIRRFNDTPFAAVAREKRERYCQFAK